MCLVVQGIAELLQNTLNHIPAVSDSTTQILGRTSLHILNISKKDIFFNLRKKPHRLDVTGVWMMNLEGEWEPGNLEFSSCLTAGSVALGKP